MLSLFCLYIGEQQHHLVVKLLIVFTFLKLLAKQCATSWFLLISHIFFTSSNLSLLLKVKVHWLTSEKHTKKTVDEDSIGTHCNLFPLNKLKQSDEEHFKVKCYCLAVINLCDANLKDNAETVSKRCTGNVALSRTVQMLELSSEHLSTLELVNFLKVFMLLS